MGMTVAQQEAFKASSGSLDVSILYNSPMERFFRSLKNEWVPGDGLHKLQRYSLRNNGLYRRILQCDQTT
ncbi:hypothetical protein SY86_13850 [Erwinia tracheiphila]|uniref:Uncharacterized protein n=1 Tax=Erwinia tracheiphila TaxID=65700 RepID=A0A0M2KA48_9GAMM|nr:hypothetical protein ETR_09925 [Erwinia tracheiphila PSU-1]KKF36275.1 hypothetical protein SY86_13850 [Erwinia tracheiphila]